MLIPKAVEDITDKLQANIPYDHGHKNYKLYIMKLYRKDNTEEPRCRHR